MISTDTRLKRVTSGCRRRRRRRRRPACPPDCQPATVLSLVFPTLLHVHCKRSMVYLRARLPTSTKSHEPSISIKPSNESGQEGPPPLFCVPGRGVDGVRALLRIDKFIVRVKPRAKMLLKFITLF